ncbi:hypothetical protein AB0B85_32490 [Micromonospora sp. NPDC049044]|uniref:hypothetical protein n=1 Tax=unclassified Micromonospora TaxID=2617518 RepID=UPI0034083537
MAAPRGAHLSLLLGSTAGPVESDHARWLRRFHPAEGCRIRLVCFPHFLIDEHHTRFVNLICDRLLPESVDPNVVGDPS